MPFANRLVRHAIMFALAAIWIIPLYMVLINAIASPDDFRNKQIWAPPSHFGLLDNVSAAWSGAKLGESVGSTLFYATAGGVAAVFLAAPRRSRRSR